MTIELLPRHSDMETALDVRAIDDAIRDVLNYVRHVSRNVSPEDAAHIAHLVAEMGNDLVGAASTQRDDYVVLEITPVGRSVGRPTGVTYRGGRRLSGRG